MATKEPKNTATPASTTNTFSKGLNKDVDPLVLQEGSYTHARNVVNNSHDGELFGRSNEPSNLHCIDLPYKLIGAIPMIDDQWVLFTTDNTSSEIGLFDESNCSYQKIVNDSCLNFQDTNLITGAFRESHDCGRKVYFADARNPDRVLNIDDIPYVKNKVRSGDCFIETATRQLDCEQLRLAPLLTVPSLTLTKSKGSGTLPNGSYQAVVAYTVNQIKVTDYLALSEVQPLFDHENLSGALELKLTNTDTDFDELELVIISTVNQQTVAKKLGIYSTHQSTIYIDTIDPALETIPLNLIPLRTPAIEKSDAVYQVNNYLLRVGVYSKPEFNYQPQANKIKTKWVSVEYPSDYYYKGGNHAGHMRDEVYPYFLRWIYNTGERTASYHIPGRAADASDTVAISGPDAIELEDGIIPKRWQVYNTATVSSLSAYQLPDGGKVIAEGDMAYWESSEKYPDMQPDIWGRLCGKNIRHHKFPDNTLAPHFSPGGGTINILGVRFEGITHPLDIDGNPITSIVGYEILRGSREGHKTIIAKGMINNMREYEIEGDPDTKGLYQNYPYNDLRPDPFLTPLKQNGSNGKVTPTNNLLSGYRKDIYSFHSPETTFSKPFLSSYELKIYQELHGVSRGHFESAYKHPKFKLTTNADDVIASIVGVLSALNVFTNGVEIGSTEDYPIGLKIGPLPPLPFNSATLPVVGTSSGGGSTPGAMVYNTLITALQGAAFVGSLVSILATMKTFTELEKEKFMSLMRTLIPRVQFAAQFNSHGFYDQYKNVAAGNIRRRISSANYIKDNIQSFDSSFRINNLYRSNAVALRITQDLPNPSVVDDSRITISQAGVSLYENFNKNISGYYTALKVNLAAQYGQLDAVKQIVISTAVQATQPVKVQKFKSTVHFGGDVYINRFTEKNSFFYFYDWLLGQPDEYEYDYTMYNNIPYPRFWVNNTQYLRSILKVSSNYRVLDKRNSSTFYIKSGYFYLFNSGVRDFFVESEVNLALRDWDDQDSKRHYDPYGYTDTSSMFRSDIIKSNNFYKYDYSLSNTRLFNSYISWGNVLSRDYDPLLSATCFSYYPKRIIYSLPQDTEFKKDNWSIFLANNYETFSSPITAIKSVNKTGALIMLKNESPVQFVGVDSLQTDAGTKVTIGDGGLFNQSLQNIVNADKSYQYGSCQGKYAVAGTPYGVFYISQEQGKIFNYAGQLEEISKYGNKYWFSRYLPSFLLKAFPDYKLYDNPVVGVGCQVVYDNTNDVVYFSKKDYKPLSNDIQVDENGRFYVPSGVSVDVCPDGYEMVEGVCTKTTVGEAPSSVVQTYPIAPSTWQDYGVEGTAIYSSFNPNGTGVFSIIDTSNSFWKAAYLFDNDPSTDVGPVNRIAVWGVGGTNYTFGDRLPINTWVGFDACVYIENPKTYYVAIAADNKFRISLNDQLIIDADQTAMGTNHGADAAVVFKRLHIYPVDLPAGNHKLRVEGYNYDSKAGFGCEIFNNTAAEIAAATSYTTLDVVFTTRDQTEFTSVVYTCAPGYGTQSQACAEPDCIKIETIDAIQVPVRNYIELGDPNYFEDASWTMSYDPKDKSWISHHDWHPDFVLPGKNHFLTVKDQQVYKHNQRCDSFCNFYGRDYPFEIEFVSSYGQAVNSVRSTEYLLESYTYAGNCEDRYHVLDHNFDRAIVYNSEQVSGMLKLNPTPKNNPRAILNYPAYNRSGIDILYSKEENKYRFNQFYDVTKDRGEFSNIPTNMFITRANGYMFQINPSYVNYQKSPDQHKKFRHNNNKVFLRRMVSGNVKMIFKIINVKVLNSPR